MVRTVGGRLLTAGRVGLLPSPFNPPTMAHRALANVAQEVFALDQVVLVLPEGLPHKRVERPSFAERLRWLVRLSRGRSDRAVASCPTGLVIDIVRAFREELGVGCELFVIAGRDAAKRYVTWDYGEMEPFSEQIKHFKLLVGSRRGTYVVAPEHSGRILPFDIPRGYDNVSSTRIREAIRSGKEWGYSVPGAIRGEVARAYRNA